MTYLLASHGHYDVTYFYLVWPAQLQEIQGYCCIDREFIHFTTHQCKPHSFSGDQRKWAYNHVYGVRQTTDRATNAQCTLYGKPR
jgi:hypothetical protein